MLTVLRICESGNLRCWKPENLHIWQFEMSEAELTNSKWHDFADLQSRFAVDMKFKVVLGIIKVFFWIHENRCWPDAARSIKFMPFPWPTGTFVFVGTRGDYEK